MADPLRPHPCARTIFEVEELNEVQENGRLWLALEPTTFFGVALWRCCTAASSSRKRDVKANCQRQVIDPIFTFTSLAYHLPTVHAGGVVTIR
jgi:hypothetical protein